MDTGPGAEWLQRIKLDILHAIQRISDTISQSHALKGVFCQSLRDAIFVILPEDRFVWETRERRRLEKKGWATEAINFRLSRDHHQMLGSIRRVVPKPDILLKAIDDRVAVFADRQDNGAPLFSEATWTALKNLKRHVIKGCISDHPDVLLYFRCDSRGKIQCARGTSSLEGAIRTHGFSLCLYPLLVAFLPFI